MDILVAIINNINHTVNFLSTLKLWEEVITDEVSINWLVSLQHGVFFDYFGLGKNFFGDALKRWSTILTIEFDSEIFIRTTRVVTSAEDDAAKAVSLFVVLVQLSDHRGHSWGREEAVLADIDFPDTVADSDLDDDLGSYVVVISSISRNNEGFTNILFFGERVENGLHEVFEVVLLFEDLHLFPEATRAGLLVLIGSRCNLFDA